jgi:hypothetical protein
MKKLASAIGVFAIIATIMLVAMAIFEMAEEADEEMDPDW